MDHEKINVSLKVKGRVQGVGFRMFVQQKAQEMNLQGYVQNEPDGSVSCKVSGARKELERLIEKIKEGPALSRVDDVVINWEQQGNVSEHGFNIRY